MSRPIEQRLDRIEGARTSAARRAAEEADVHLAVARAKVAIGAVVRHAMLRAGIDPACAPCLAQADEAAASLAASGDTVPAPNESDMAALCVPFDPTRPPDAFEARILALAKKFADGGRPDFGKTSFAELFAWSTVRLSAQPPPDSSSPAPDPPAAE